MAKKKSEKKEATPTKQFLWKEELFKMKISLMLKNGVAYHVESNDLTIKNEKDLEKVINDYTKLNVGE